MALSSDHIRVARVLAQDDKFMTLEVLKTDDEPVHVHEGDEFLTLIFVRQERGGVESWMPWEARDG